MTPRKKTKPERMLTEVELELMNVIWNLGECTVREVQESLPKERDLAYTSVATMMKILEQKGILTSHAPRYTHDDPVVTYTRDDLIATCHVSHRPLPMMSTSTGTDI